MNNEAAQESYARITAKGRVECTAAGVCHPRTACLRNQEVTVAETSVPNQRAEISQGLADAKDTLENWTKQPERDCQREDNPRSGYPLAVNRQYGSVGYAVESQ